MVSIGDTTGSVYAIGNKADLVPNTLTSRFVKIDVLPFDSQRKRMTVLGQCEDGCRTAFMKGASEALQHTPIAWIETPRRIKTSAC
jgi:magnesium-transporting ATPase (P-type)